MFDSLCCLAEQQYLTRSSIARQALAEYILKPANKVIANPSHEVTQLKYELIKGKHPYVNPNDASLIEIIYNSSNGSRTSG